MQAQTTPPPNMQKPAPPPLVSPPPKPAVVPFPTGAMIGYVVYQSIVQDSKLGKCGQNQMKAFQDRRTPELQAKQKEVVALQQQIAQQTGVVADAKISQMTRELDKVQREFSLAQEQYKADSDALNEELLSDFQARLMPIIESVRAEKGLWAVFAYPESNMIAKQPGLDLSVEAIQKLDIAVPSCGK
jgi:Skp family chaperone for outer membrane proteins